MPFPLHQIAQEAPALIQKLTEDKNTRVTFSQLGEDIITRHLLSCHLPPVQGGFYVDVGAHHPRTISNTYHLWLSGWRGLNIDADPHNIEAFRAERPNDINVCCGVGNEETVMTFYEFEGRQVSTFSESHAILWEKTHGLRIISKKRIRVRPLESILNEFLPDNQEIKYLNIDVEEMDHQVITSFDIERWRPALITIEINHIDRFEAGQNRTVAYLRGYDYLLVGGALSSHVFIDQRKAINL